jgi:FkbM family methyltransferase
MKLISVTKRSIQKSCHSLGLEVKRLSIRSNPYVQILKALNHFNIDTVFDIGANTGQFASEIRSFGYTGKIVSFEPLSDAYQELVSMASRDAKWLVHERGAIGDFNGEIKINVAGNSTSSSVLPMLDSHISAAEKSAYVRTENAPIYCLDFLSPAYLLEKNSLFVKIDVQGFEWQVLDGAKETLKKACGVLCELSLISLYKNQHLWFDMLHRFEAEGFTLWSIQPGFADPRNGRTLQVDAIFFRTE